jgi:hypothetical protein
MSIADLALENKDHTGRRSFASGFRSRRQPAAYPESLAALI